MARTQKEVANLHRLAKPGGVKYWNAGLRRWVEYLQSGGFRDHI